MAETRSITSRSSGESGPSMSCSEVEAHASPNQMANAYADGTFTASSDMRRPPRRPATISPRSEEVVIGRVAHTPDRARVDLGASTGRRDAADGVDALNARDLAERPGAAFRLRRQQQPGYR